MLVNRGGKEILVFDGLIQLFLVGVFSSVCQEIIVLFACQL